MLDYPAALGGYDPIATYGAKHKKLLAELAPRLFSDDISIWKFDVARDSTGQIGLLRDLGGGS